MKQNNQKKKLIFLILNIILSVIVFVITYFIDPLKYANNTSMAAIPAFLLSVVILIIGQTINTFTEVERVSENSNLICETVKNYLHITKIGTPKAAWEYIVNRLSVLEYVQNTSFNMDYEIDKSAERLYECDNYKQSFNQISKAINHGLIWKDIGDESAVDRFNTLSILVNNKSKGQYLYRYMNQSAPQIGFIILTYKDGTTEVLFNWDFREIPQDPVVLLSRDQEIINMFAAQYNGLWRMSVADYDNNATKSTS